MKESPDHSTFRQLYQEFSLPLSRIDCGQKCGSYNTYGIPVCCDIRQVVPSAYIEEWSFLESESNLWKIWDGSLTKEGKELLKGLESNQIPLQCLGYQHCQRRYRTITCRAFPFLPYIDLNGEFVGFTYYPDFIDRCWVISNLSLVTLEYKKEFQRAFQDILKIFPEMKKNYLYYSDFLRDLNLSQRYDLIVLDFQDNVFKIDPATGFPHEINFDDLPAFGPFKVSKEMQFPDEIDLKLSGRGSQ